MLTTPVGFIGAGKVGTALAALLHARGANVVSVSGRGAEDGLRMAEAAGLPAEAAAERAGTLRRADIIFLTVQDDAIEPLCHDISLKEGWRPGQGVVHCSGALPSDILSAAREQGALVASCHPLQAFATVQAAIDNMPGSTFAIEGDRALVKQLRALVRLLGGTAVELDSSDKTLYHAAAVIASNYTVTLAALASDLLVRCGVAPDENTALRYLLPLIRGTVENLGVAGLPDALTGPLARGDAGTVARHLQQLDVAAPEIAALYRHLARLTLPIAQAKGGLDDEIIERMRKEIM